MSEPIEGLKPCPFCGHNAPMPELDEAQGFKWGAIVCGCCGAKGPEVRTTYGVDDEFIADACEAWNKRQDRMMGG